MIEMEIKLRPYQQEFIAKVQAEIDAGTTRICAVAPCGSGKTVMAGWLIRKWLRLGKRIIFFVHRQELVEQAARTFEKLGLPFGLIAAGVEADYSKPLQIAMQQTLVRRLKKIDAPDILICDECHHIAADSYRRIICFWKKAVLIGLTATPERTGGKRLGEFFQAIITGATANQLIDWGALTHYSYIAPTLVHDAELRKVRLISGDYDRQKLAKVMLRNELIGGIVDNYQKYSSGEAAICFCVNVEHSEQVAERFRAAGINAVHIDHSADKDSRRRIVEDFRAGEIKILCNVGLFGEGFDVPGVYAVILARPTRSLPLFIQQSMRALRIDPTCAGKVAVIIDHVENYKRFGFPDMNHEWSLEENEKPESAQIRLKDCPKCGAVVSTALGVCPECGYQFPVQPKSRYVKEREDRLEEIYASESGKPLIIREYEAKLIIALRKNYKLKWAIYQTVGYAKTEFEVKLLAARARCSYKWALELWQDKKAQ